MSFLVCKRSGWIACLQVGPEPALVGTLVKWTLRGADVDLVPGAKLFSRLRSGTVPAAIVSEPNAAGLLQLVVNSLEAMKRPVPVIVVELRGRAILQEDLPVSDYIPVTKISVPANRLNLVPRLVSQEIARLGNAQGQSG